MKKKMEEMQPSFSGRELEPVISSLPQGKVRVVDWLGISELTP
eukprot:CAMPEP_0178379194 /NCGR_PEP_ID=MMETSP0689_2-20121128/4815_1 /TAXON_ID=160604 /ORGANISM="Amphidinium massartii, Strain CS-259" /LENGTH=42 /DNA_ID= /DNA_START= /DNA_END= /DNA_ORIENTATION=